MNLLSDIYRKLPSFKGKKRLGRFLFRKAINENKDRLISCNNGLRFHILNTHDSVGRDLFLDGVYEPQTQYAIGKELKRGDVFIDVGANIGSICLPMAKKKNITVFAFEPATNIMEVLKKNILLNQIRNIKFLPLGLADRICSTDFYESDRVHGWSGMVKVDTFQHYKVPTTTLDAFTKENKIDRIAVLKVDVQGWEYYVFKGAEELLNNKRIDHIIFEFESWSEKNAGLQLGAAQQLLLDKGFTLNSLNGKKIINPFTSGSMMIHAKIN